ncbi:hypothetical protein RFI_01490 [Reticulomyxa filosa]|uniref:Uncharacterized protein n=1 Tax=Reticulomyxa filosa TaxID=46433 RepID=X6PD16_RETFI|nr:hypothetical protein RFI_01490 [Reticulomyxa filosa]|eukprot:ETO35572.1 hypothetical protein RFI_01490 [Reticulomyxa filosa]
MIIPKKRHFLKELIFYYNSKNYVYCNCADLCCVQNYKQQRLANEKKSVLFAQDQFNTKEALLRRFESVYHKNGFLQSLSNSKQFQEYPTNNIKLDDMKQLNRRSNLELRQYRPVNREHENKQLIDTLQSGIKKSVNSRDTEGLHVIWYSMLREYSSYMSKIGENLVKTQNKNNHPHTLMPLPLHLYGELIQAFGILRECGSALDIYKFMKDQSFPVDQYSISLLIMFLAENRYEKVAWQVYQEFIETLKLKRHFNDLETNRDGVDKNDNDNNDDEKLLTTKEANTEQNNKTLFEKQLLALRSAKSSTNHLFNMDVQVIDTGSDKITRRIPDTHVPQGKSNDTAVFTSAIKIFSTFGNLEQCYKIFQDMICRFQVAVFVFFYYKKMFKKGRGFVCYYYYYYYYCY